MAINIKIMLDGMYKDIDIDYSTSFTYTERFDGTNKLGGFNCYLNRRSNIPPFTPCKIIESGKKYQEKYWFCSSESDAILTQDNLYYHSVKLIDGVEILKCYFLGAKAFSVLGTYKTDYDKMLIINSLIKEKYDYGIIIRNLNVEDVLTKEQTFSFSENNTLFDVITTILSAYNMTFYVYDISGKTIYLELVSQNELGNDINLNDNRILDIKRSQNDDLYCDLLETSLENVVDRTNTLTANDLVVHSEEDVITYDNAKLILPTNAEQIVNTKITNITLSLEMIIYITPAYVGKMPSMTWFSYNDLTDASAKAIIGDLLDYIKLFTDKYGKTSKIFYYIVPTTNVENPYCLRIGEKNAQLSYVITAKYLDVSEYVLEKSEWSLLDADVSNQYLYYENGKNYITNFQGGKNKGIINSILGIEKKDFLYTLSTSFKLKLVNILKKYSGASVEANTDLGNWGTELIDDIFSVNYVAYTNPYLINGEASGKSIARPYQLSSNAIDYDKLVPFLNKIKSQMGKPECTITYDATDIEESINVFDRIHFSDDDIETYYIQSIQKVYDTVSTTYIMNCTTAQMTYAYNINIENQFEPTTNPTDDIIVRKINLTAYINSSNFYQLFQGNLYARFNFDGKYLYKRIVLQYYGNPSRAIAYVECMDEYCFDISYGQSSGGKYITKYNPYVDKYNECKYVEVDIFQISNLTIAEARAMPICTRIANTINSDIRVERTYIYKDARERLTFTIEIKME